MARRRKPTGSRKLLINAIEPEESRIAVLQGGQLDEYYIERQSLGSTLGNIYKARVTNVEKSIGAAFVEFGHNRQGFLHVSDLCMSAVGDEAKALLATVQAAREVAHDEDVVERAPAAPALPHPDDSAAAPEAETVVGEATPDAATEPEDEDEGEEGAEEDKAYSPDTLVDPWTGESSGEDERGSGLPPLAGDPASESEDDGPEPEEPEDLDEPDEQDSPLAQGGGGARSLENAAGGAEAAATAVAAPDDEDEGGERRRDAGGSRRGRRGRRGRRSRANGRGGPRREQRQMPPIEQILQKGQEIVVQVIKDGIGTKGPTLTTYLSIPGRFIVLMPGIAKRGVSRKVTDGAERDRLKNIVRELEAPEGLGFIVRTAGSGCSREELQRDLEYLLRLWERMDVRIREHTAPVLLYQENDLVIRTLRDLYDGQGEIVIDDQATAATAREFMAQIMPDCVDRVQTFTENVPLFSHYGLESELTKLLDTRVELKSGASVVIEQTEALVAIDVNSGRFKPGEGKDVDETAYTVNCEAAVEIARQMRLRDLGGVVVIDFIDMRQEKHRKQLERLFKEELRKDRARIKVARFSPFGILEMTRQRVRPSLKRTVHQACPYCEGTGFIPSDETSCLGVIRKIRENLWRPGSVLVVTVRPEVAEAVLNEQKQALVELEAQGRRQIFIRADHRLAYDNIDVRAMIAMPDDMDHRRA